MGELPVAICLLSVSQISVDYLLCLCSSFSPGCVGVLQQEGFNYDPSIMSKRSQLDGHPSSAAAG